MGGGVRVAAVLVAVWAIALWWGLGNAFLAGDGKGPPANDCLIGLDGIEPADVVTLGGKPAAQCTDCDPRCDADGEADGACTFDVSTCVNRPDVAGCAPGPIATATVSPAGVGLRVPSPLPADTEWACEPGAVVVTTRKRGAKPGKRLVRLKARTAGSPKRRDTDAILFVCNPRPEGEACPDVETTTSTVPGLTTSTLLATTTTSVAATTTSSSTVSTSSSSSSSSTSTSSSSSSTSSSVSSSTSSSSSSVSTSSSTSTSSSSTSTSKTTSSTTSTSSSSTSTSKTTSTSTSSTTTSTWIPSCSPNCTPWQACLSGSNCASGLCASGFCRCPAHAFTFSIDSNTGGTADPAEWPGGEATQSASTGCSATVRRPSGNLDIVGPVGPEPLADAFALLGFSGFSQCTLSGCSTTDCPPLGIGSCAANRPSCSAALNGGGAAQITASCTQ